MKAVFKCDDQVLIISDLEFYGRQLFNTQNSVIQQTTKMNFSKVTLGGVKEWYLLLYRGMYGRTLSWLCSVGGFGAAVRHPASIRESG